VKEEERRTVERREGHTLVAMRREVRRKLGVEEVLEVGLLAFAEHGVWRREQTRRVEVSPINPYASRSTLEHETRDRKEI
jgi:hypothetical protein